MTGNVNHPKHYTDRNIGHECIDIAQYQTFCTGNVIKYLWRYKDKRDPVEDLKKARWYARRAATRHELTDTTGRCGHILHKLVQSTTGPERVAWHGICTSDWHMTIEAMNRMIEEEDK